MSCLRNDFRFLLVVLCVEHLMLYAAQLDEVAEHFACFHVDRTDKNRLSALMAGHDLLHNRIELALAGLINDVVHIVARNGFISRDLHNVKAVNALELLFLGLCRTRHAADLSVHALQWPDAVRRCSGGPP